MNSQDSPWLELGGNHHLPPYSILYGSPQGYTQTTFFSGIAQFPKIGTFVTLDAHNFLCRPLIEVRSKEKLYFLSKVFQIYVARFLKACNSRKFLTFNGQKSN
jgi:hypothetical protein